MNRIYRIVFNRALGLLQVASEVASARGPGSGRGASAPRRSLLALAVALATWPALAQVAPGQLPTGGTVVGGDATIGIVDDTMTINQASARALLKWGTFDIGKDATVAFNQVAGGIALNQIMDVKPSEVMGTLTATGTIFLINPNGIIFGNEATVNVGSLVASSLSPDDEDLFMEEDADGYVHDTFTWNVGGAGEVINHGSIQSSGGNVVLLGGSARNAAAGSIDVGDGIAALLAGGAAQVELLPGGTPVVRITGAASAAPASGVVVENAGDILAAGGTIILHGELADGLLDTVVNNSGTLQAGGLAANPDGTISLVANGGDLVVTGTVDADDGQVALASSDHIDLGATLVAGTLEVDADSLEQDSAGGTVTVSGTTSIQTAGDATFNRGGNDFGGTVHLDVGGHALLVDGNGLTLGNVDAGVLSAQVMGNLSLGTGVIHGDLWTSATGNIVQSGAIEVGGTSWLNSSGNITLTNGGNDFRDRVDIQAQNVAITDRNALVLGSLSVRDGAFRTMGALNLGSGSLRSLRAHTNGGDISQSGALTLTSDFIVGTDDGAGGYGSVTLDNAGNDFNTVNATVGSTTIVDVDDIRFTGGRSLDLSVRANGDITLNELVTINGNLSLDTGGGGSITQTGVGPSIYVQGTSDLKAGTQSIILNRLQNRFSGAVNLAGGAVTIMGTDGLTLGDVAVHGLTAQTQAGTLSLGRGTVAGNLSAQVSGSGGNITQSGALSVGGTSTLQITSTGSIVLDNTSNDFAGTVSASTGNGLVRLSDANSLSLTATANSLEVTTGGTLNFGTVNLSGNLQAEAASGGIQQTGAVRVAGTTSLDAGNSNITLTNTGNDFGGAVDLSGDAVSIVDTNSLALGNIDVSSLYAKGSTIGLSRDVDTAGGQQYDGALQLGADVAMTAGDNVAFGSTVDGAYELTVQAGGAVHFGGAVGSTTALAGLEVDAGSFSAASTIDVSGDLGVAVTSGWIGQVGAFRVGGNASFDAGNGNIILTNPGNDFSGRVGLRGGAVLIVDANTLDLDVVDTASLYARAATINLANDVDTTGDQQYDGALELGADVALTAGGNVGFGSTVDGAHELVVQAGGAVDFGGAVGSNAALAGLDVHAGSFSAASTIDVGGNLGVAVTAGGIAQSGAFRVGGNAGFDAGTGNISLVHAGNDFAGTVDLRGNAVSIADANTLTLGAVDAASLYAGAATIGLSNDVDTTGDQEYDGAVVLGVDVALTAGGNVAFGSTVDGAHGLAVHAGGAVDFGDAVGGTTALDRLEVDAGSFHAASGIAVSGDLAVTVATGGISQGGAFHVGGNASFDAGTGDIELSNADNDFAGTVDLAGANVTVQDRNALALGSVAAGNLSVTSNGALGLGGGTVTGNLVASSGGGDVSQGAALGVQGSTSIDSGGGSITLDNAGNDFAGTVNLQGGAARVRDANALTLGTLDVASLDVVSGGALSLGSGVIAGDLDATSSSGGITQAGALQVGGASAIDAGASAIDLTNAGNDFAGTVDLRGGAVAVTDANHLALGDIEASSLYARAAGIGLSSDVDTTGNQLYDGAVQLGADVALSAGGDIGFNSTVDGPHQLSVEAGGAATFGGAVGSTTPLGGLDVDAGTFSAASSIDVAGDLAVTVASGNITQAGAFRVGGNASFDAGAGNIVLLNGGNDFTGTVDLSGNAVLIADANVLDLGLVQAASLYARAATIGLDNDVSTSGDQEYDGAVVLGADVTVSAGGNVAFDATVDGAHQLSVQAGGAVDFGGAVGSTTALAGLDVDAGSFSASSIDVSGDLAVTVAAGNITQSGAFRVGGDASFDAGDGNIALTNAGNDFAGTVDLRGGAAAIVDANTLELGTVEVASLYAKAATIGLGSDVDTSGDQEYDGALQLRDDVTLTAGGNVAFDSTVDGAHQLTVQAGGAVDFGGAVGATTALAGLSVDAGGFNAASTVVVSGDMDVTVDAGNITQSGAFRVGGNASFDAGSGNITLANAGNDFAGPVDLRGNAVSIADANALDLGTLAVNSLVASSGGALDLGHGSVAGALSATTANNAITQDGALSVGGTVTLQAGSGSITLDNAGNDFAGVVNLDGGVATIVDANGLVLGTLDLASLSATAGGALSLGSGTIAGDLAARSSIGGITQSGPLYVGGASLVDAGAASITLDNAGNDFVGPVELRGGAVVIADANALRLAAGSVGSLDARSGGALELGGGNVTGNLTVSSGGVVTQTGAISVGGTSTVDAGSNAITLDNAGNDFTGVVNLQGGAVAIADANTLALGTVNAASLDAHGNTGLDLGTSTISGNLVASTSGGAITQSGALKVGGTSDIDAGAGAITLDNAGNDFGGAVSLAGGVATIVDANGLVLGTLDLGGLSASAGGALSLGTGSIAGTLEVTSASGGITQAGPLFVGGVSTIDAGSGAITLDNAGNDFVGPVNLRGGVARIADANTLVLGEVDVHSLYARGNRVELEQDVDTTGNQEYDGALVLESDVYVSAGGDVAFGSTVDGAHRLSVEAGGAVEFRGAVGANEALASLDVDAGSFDAASTIDVAGDMDVTVHAGDIAQSGAFRVGGDARFDAGSGRIDLGNAGNDFAGLVDLRGGDTTIADANDLVLGTLAVGSLAASSGGNLDLGSGRIAGALVATTANGAVTQGGALAVGGTSSIDAGSGDITLDDDGNAFGGRVNLAGGAVAIASAGTLALGSVDAGNLQARAATIGLHDDVTTLGDQVYDGAVVLATDVDLEAGGSVDFASTVDGAHRLGVDADGAVQFGGAVGAGTALAGLDVEAGSFAAASTIDVSGDLSIVLTDAAGSMALAATSAGIGQNGAFRVGGNAYFDAGTGDVVLDNAGNDFRGAVELRGGAISIVDANDLAISRLHSGQDADVRVVAGGGLTLPAGAIDTGTGALYLAANGGRLVTGAPLAGGEVTLVGGNGITLGGDVDASTSLHLQSGADVVQDSGRIATPELTGSIAGNARLSGANLIDAVGGFSARGLQLANAQSLRITGPVEAGPQALVQVTSGDLQVDGRLAAENLRLEVAGGIGQGSDGQLAARSLSGRAGGVVALGGEGAFVDNQVEQIGDFVARAGFSMTNGRSLTLVSLNGSNFTIDAGTAAFYIEVDGDLRQVGTERLYNGVGRWAATGGIGLSSAPIYVIGLEPQEVVSLGRSPAYFHALRPDGGLLPVLGQAVNLPTSLWAGRAQSSSNRQVAYVDLGADASNYRGYGLVEPGIRLPDDQQPECDPDFPDAGCAEAL